MQKMNTVKLPGGHSASYLRNNSTKSDTYIAMAKNGYIKSRIVIHRLDEIEN